MSAGFDKPAIDPELADIKAGMAGVYERQAHVWDKYRPRVFYEKAWLDRFIGGLPAGATIADVGCGAGDPIAVYFVENGFRLIGVDQSQPMLDIAVQRLPGADLRRQDMRALDLGEQVSGLISWDAFFHLSQDEQRATLPIFADHILPGGSIMLTVGPEAGEEGGHVGDEPVYHASLDEDEYCSILTDCGFANVTLTRDDPDCDFRSILLASDKRD